MIDAGASEIVSTGIVAESRETQVATGYPEIQNILNQLSTFEVAFKDQVSPVRVSFLPDGRAFGIMNGVGYDHWITETQGLYPADRQNETDVATFRLAHADFLESHTNNPPNPEHFWQVYHSHMSQFFRNNGLDWRGTPNLNIVSFTDSVDKGGRTEDGYFVAGNMDDFKNRVQQAVVDKQD